MEVNGHLQAPASLSPEEDSLVPRVGLRTGENGWRQNKYLPLAEIEPRMPDRPTRKLVNIPSYLYYYVKGKGKGTVQPITCHEGLERE